MITEVYLDDVTSYTSSSKLNPTNKISLIYGLNGAGKSTISNFLYNPTSLQYQKCRIRKNTDSDILVYNQDFLSDYFYEKDSLKGIFTLSKENKTVLQQIDQQNIKLDKLEKSKIALEDDLNKVQVKLQNEKKKAIDNVWKIKKIYTGGDRIFEFCLDGLKKSEKLYTHLISISLPTNEPKHSIESLKSELETIQGDKAIPLNKLTRFSFTGMTIEQNDIFQKIIVGSQEGSVAEFINKIGNSDWIKNGLNYIPNTIDDSSVACPFCQENTITKELLSSIEEVFDESYENDISLLKNLKQEYLATESELNFPEIEHLVVVNSDISKEWNLNIEKIKSIYRENVLLIDNKLKNPSTPIALKDSVKVSSDIDNIILEINELISTHNEKLINKSNSLSDIKKRFWEKMRWDYEPVLSASKTSNKKIEKEQTFKDSEISTKKDEITNTNTEISMLREKTVNIEKAIENINNALTDIGIVGFSVVKYQDNLYRVARSDSGSDAFHSLSEGEKTVISFLYFIELCKGEKTASNNPKKKIIVINDPISSLSHLYVFNIGQLIKRTFFNSDNCEQVFVLTHSLYFFYELTHTNKETRKETQNLFRIIKNTDGSSIVDMRYEEIQNDYQTYWSMIKDESTPPALIANCMRNIIEYFFNFVQKKDFNNVFQMPVLSSDKFKTFYRYMNRESHSLGQNIFDIKEFDYENFKEGLKLIFKECGYEDHYKAMMK